MFICLSVYYLYVYMSIEVQVIYANNYIMAMCKLHNIYMEKQHNNINVYIHS